MNVVTGDSPLATLKGYNGVYARGKSDTCPQDHLLDCFNCIFDGQSQVNLREPVTTQAGFPVSTLLATNVISYFIANVAGGAALLTLDASGNFYDETHATLLAPAGAFVTADDFVAVNMFGRTYISFKSQGRANPLFGLYVFYYSSVASAYVLRTVVTSPPFTSPTVTQPAAGNVDAGVHQFAVCFVNENGTLSIPCTAASITSTGVNNILLSNIPLGGSPVGVFGSAAVVGRVILATRANQQEFFFVPGGEINDNTTTSLSLNFFDTSLTVSADYLWDLIPVVPGCSAIRYYKSRMVLIGRSVSPDEVLVSNQTFVEQFNAVSGVSYVPVDYGVNTSSTGAVIRDSLYIMKPNGTYVLQDNGGDPGTWPVDIVDAGMGAYDNGLSLFASAMSGQDVFDSCLVLHKSGLRLFTGTFTDPPLTWKIESLWNLISADDLWLCTVAHDHWNKRIYISVPLSPPTALGSPITRALDRKCHIILMGDYKEGLNAKNIKWSLWNTATASTIYKMSMENFTMSYTVPQMIFQLALCSGTAHIFKIIPANTPYLPDVNPAGGYFAINQYIITPPIEVPPGIFVFTMLDFDVDGVGNMQIGIFDKNRSSAAVMARTFNLSSYTHQNLQRFINYLAETMQISLQCDLTFPSPNVNGAFSISALHVYGKKMYNSRPALTESA